MLVRLRHTRAQLPFTFVLLIFYSLLFGDLIEVEEEEEWDVNDDDDDDEYKTITTVVAPRFLILLFSIHTERILFVDADEKKNKLFVFGYCCLCTMSTLSGIDDDAALQYLACTEKKPQTRKKPNANELFFNVHNNCTLQPKYCGANTHTHTHTKPQQRHTVLASHTDADIVWNTHLLLYLLLLCCMFVVL